MKSIIRQVNKMIRADVFIAALLFSTSSIFLSTSCIWASGKSSPPGRSVAGKAEELVWIGKPDEATSCGVGSGIELDAMANQLKASGIKVMEKRKIHDSKARIAMCGIDKGTMNGFLIPKSDAAKASSLGFKILQDKF